MAFERSVQPNLLQKVRQRKAKKFSLASFSDVNGRSIPNNTCFKVHMLEPIMSNVPLSADSSREAIKKGAASQQQ